MRALVAVGVIVWTLLLVGIAIELRRIDTSLEYLAAPMRGLVAWKESVSAPQKPETREERIARKRRELSEMKETFEEDMEAAGLSAPKGKSATVRTPPR